MRCVNVKGGMLCAAHAWPMQAAPSIAPARSPTVVVMVQAVCLLDSCMTKASVTNPERDISSALQGRVPFAPGMAGRGVSIPVSSASSSGSRGSSLQATGGRAGATGGGLDSSSGSNNTALIVLLCLAPVMMLLLCCCCHQALRGIEGCAVGTFDCPLTTLVLLIGKQRVVSER
jgi:hypothetical protein